MPVFSTSVFCAILAFLAAQQATAQCLELSQPLQQGSLVWSTVDPGSAVLLDGETVAVLPDGSTMFGFGRDAGPQASLVVTATNNSGSCQQTLEIHQRNYRISRVDGVPAQTVTPPKEQLERIRRERTLVVHAKSQRLPRPELIKDLIKGMQWPLVGRISGVYGSQRIYNGVPNNPHYGVDIARPTGSPVIAPSRGVVTLAEPDLFFSGGTVILDHGYGLSSSFLHLSQVHVKPGQEIKRGDLLGEVGATGRATGPHLDWRMSWLDRRIDPQLLLPPMPVNTP